MKFINETISLLFHTATLAIELGDRETKAIISNNLGAFSAMNGDLNAAINHYFDALKNYEEMDLAIRKPTPLTNIGFILENQGELGEALNYHLKSYELSRQLGRNKGMAESLHNLANNFV